MLTNRQSSPSLSVTSSLADSGTTVSLPSCDLHYIKAGSGPPLILCPATMSDSSEWVGLIEFMAQRFTVFFFELPGHGRSTPLSQYSSRQVARVITDWLDALGLERFSLMGFSFGGILTLTTLDHLADRVDQVILISPLVDSAALRLSAGNKLLYRSLATMAQSARMQQIFIRMLNSHPGSRFWAHFMVRVGNLEHPDMLTGRFRTLPLTTIQALAGQSKEIFDTHHFKSARYSQTCYFAMSVRDPLLDFSFTSTAVKRIFSIVDEVRLDLPYHRPREPLTFEYLQHTFGHLLDRIP